MKADLTFQKSSSLAGCVDVRRSASGFAIFFWTKFNLGVQVNRQQSPDPVLYIKAEYKALVNATDELIWFKVLLGELGVILTEKPCLW